MCVLQDLPVPEALHGAVMNAANEVAVSAFLQERTAFLSIPAIVEDTLAAMHDLPAGDLPALLDADARARRFADARVAARAAAA